MPGSVPLDGEPAAANPQSTPDLVKMMVELTAKVAALGEGVHSVKGVQSSRLAGETMADRIASRLPAAALATAPPLPRGLTIAFAVAAGTVSFAGVIGVIVLLFNTYASFQVQGREMSTRMLAMEAWKTEMVAAGIPAEIRELKNLSRTRDLQYADLKDTITGLRQSDAAGLQQVQELLRSFTALSTQMEGVRRELGEMKEQMRRGSFYMPSPQRGNNDAPARWVPPASPT
jgi:hypothetical protein